MKSLFKKAQENICLHHAFPVVSAILVGLSASAFERGLGCLKTPEVPPFVSLAFFTSSAAMIGCAWDSFIIGKLAKKGVGIEREIIGRLPEGARKIKEEQIKVLRRRVLKRAFRVGAASLVGAGLIVAATGVLKDVAVKHQEKIAADQAAAVLDNVLEKAFWKPDGTRTVENFYTSVSDKPSTLTLTNVGDGFSGKYEIDMGSQRIMEQKFAIDGKIGEITYPDEPKTGKGSLGNKAQPKKLGL